MLSPGIDPPSTFQDTGVCIVIVSVLPKVQRRSLVASLASVFLFVFCRGWASYPSKVHEDVRNPIPRKAAIQKTEALQIFDCLVSILTLMRHCRKSPPVTEDKESAFNIFLRISSFLADAVQLLRKAGDDLSESVYSGGAAPDFQCYHSSIRKLILPR